MSLLPGASLTVNDGGKIMMVQPGDAAKLFKSVLDAPDVEQARAAWKFVIYSVRGGRCHGATARLVGCVERWVGGLCLIKDGVRMGSKERVAGWGWWKMGVIRAGVVWGVGGRGWWLGCVKLWVGGWV